MKFLALLLTGILIQPAHAQLGAGNTDIQPVYSCFGLDGVPIPTGSTMYSQCCTNGQLNPGASSAMCRAGFHTISGDSAGGAASNITLAQQTLGVAASLNGVQTNINLVNAPNSGINSVTPGKASSASGLVSAGNGSDGTGLPGAHLAGGREGRGGSGAGGGSGSGSGGFSGLGDGSGSGANGKSGNKTDPNADANKPLGGGFAANGGGNGKDGSFGSMDMNFGGNGSGNGADGSGNGMDEIGFGDEQLAEGEAGSDVEGTIHDPANYFALTNKGDNLFKIVERRYQKKWKKLVLKGNGRLPAGQGRPQQNKPL